MSSQNVSPIRSLGARSKTETSSASLRESPDVTAKRFYYDELVFNPRAIRFLLDTFGDNQICVGTDYPFALGDSRPLQTLSGTDFNHSVLEKITVANAKRFLGLR